MNIQHDIKQQLTAALTPSYLEVINESHQHSVPENSETHFKVVIASEAFSGQRQVARHQRIYAVLAAQLEGPVHALALHTYTPQEWSAREQQSVDSPQCLGGSKGEV